MRIQVRLCVHVVLGKVETVEQCVVVWCWNDVAGR